MALFQIPNKKLLNFEPSDNENIIIIPKDIRGMKATFSQVLQPR